MLSTILYVLMFALLWVFCVFIFTLNATCPKTATKKNMNVTVIIVTAELLRIMLLAGIFGVFSLFSLAIEAVTIHATNYWWIIGMGFGEGAWVVSEYCAAARLKDVNAERPDMPVILAHINTCVTVLSWALFLLAP